MMCRYSDTRLPIIYLCRIVNFETSASANRATGGGRNTEEFLVLMEYCPAVLSDLIRTRNVPYPPDTVARIFTQVKEDSFLCNHSARYVLEIL